MPTIEANELQIGYGTAGSGPPLVLVHGATSSGHDNFGAQIPVLARLFRIYAPDARGHASTRWDATAGFRAEWLVDDLAGFVDALALDSVHLLGFSMGGMTALAFSAQHPHRVRSLVVAGISPLREPRASVARGLMDPDRIERDDRGWAAVLARRHDGVQGVGAWRRLLPAIAQDVADQALLAPGALHAIAAPALVIAGDRDPFTPVDQAWAVSRQLGHGRLLIVPNSGHDVFAGRPHLVNEALLGFYRSLPSLGGEPTDAAGQERGVT